MLRPLTGLAALALALLFVAPPASAQSNLSNCKYYTKTQQDFQQGLPYCTACIEDAPENPEARYYGAWCLAEVGRWDEAWQSFSWLIEREGSKDKKIRKHAKMAKQRVQQYFVDHFNAGVEALNAGNTADARNEFWIATQIYPSKPEGHLNLGFTLNQLGDTQGAIDAFRQAIEIAPDQEVGYEYLSVALGNRRERLMQSAAPDTAALATLREEYRATLEKVLEFKPQNDAALLQLGDLALADGDVDGAIELFQRSIAIAPDNVLKLYNVGVAFYERDDYPNSARVFGLVADEIDDPADSTWRDAMYNLGLSQHYGGDNEAAVATMERLVEVDPTQADYFRILARAYSAIGNSQKASDNLMKYDALNQQQQGS